MSTRINWTIWSGEGDRGYRETKSATLQGIKRILTIERCNGDRWAYACPQHWPHSEAVGYTKECNIDNFGETDMVEAARAQQYDIYPDFL